MCYYNIQDISKAMDESEKYASVYQILNFPQTRKLIPVHQSLFKTGSSDDLKYVTSGIKNSRNQLIQNIEKQLDIYDNVNYHFKFPPSKFPNVPRNQRNNITYEQKMQSYDEDTFKDKLSYQQILQMKQKGEFQVKSNLQNVSIPYVWKINDFLLRGRVNIINIWENGLAWCYGLLYEALLSVKSIIPQNLKYLAHLPIDLFTLLFGKRSLTAIYIPNYNRQVYKDFWTDIFSNQLNDLKSQVGHDLLQALYLKYEPVCYQSIYKTAQMSNQQYIHLQRLRQQKITIYNGKKNKIDETKNSLNKIQETFQNNWVKIRRKILTKVTNQVQGSYKQKVSQNEEDPLSNKSTAGKDQPIVDQFNKQKYLIYTAHLKQYLPEKNISLKVIQALTSLILIVSIIDDKIRNKRQKLSQVKQKIIRDIEKKYRIRSKNRRFRQSLTQQAYKPIQQHIQKQFYDKLLQDKTLESLPAKYQSIYNKYLNLLNNLDKLIKQKQSNLKCIYTPQRVFKTTYRLLPPYQLLKQGDYYYLQKQRQMTIDTSTNFWKFKLYAMRLKSWTINCAIFLLGFSWVGPFGFRCLFGTKEFKYDQYCDLNTGVKHNYTRKTVLGVFQQVRAGVTKSRQHFQSLPDRGLFGKKFSRYFNYFQCYVFRFLFVGIIGVLIIYPLSIIILSLLCVILVFTTWAWVPLIMFICYLFNILVFQFESSNRHSGIFISGIPLLSLLITIVVVLLQIVYSIIFLSLISPIITAFYCLYLIIQRGFRTFTDTIMLFIIGKLGRTPSRDTSIARKISGPGMSRDYFYSINQEDVYVITQSALQKIFVNKFIETTRSKIQCQTNKYYQIMQFALSPFGFSNPSLQNSCDIVVQNKNSLMNTFNNQVSYYMARYPNYPTNIRFTEEEIDQYFDNCIKIVKNFVQRQRIQEWVFDQHSVLNEDYEQLTRALWVEIFNCGDQIFQPLQTIDGRFKFQQNLSSNSAQMKKSIGSIMKALQGQIELTHRAANFNPAKRSLLDKDRQFNYINQICNLHSNNSQLSLNSDVKDPKYILFCPKNLQELKVYDIYNRNDILNRYKSEKIIEE